MNCYGKSPLVATHRQSTVFPLRILGDIFDPKSDVFKIIKDHLYGISTVYKEIN